MEIHKHTLVVNYQQREYKNFGTYYHQLSVSISTNIMPIFMVEWDLW